MNRAPLTSPLKLIVLALALFALAAIPSSSALAQQNEGPTFSLRILDIDHDPSGQLTFSVRVSGDTEIDPPQFTALVDGIPQSVSTTPSREVDLLSVVIAIDTSGSMLGAPLEAAREAANTLIGQLNEGDEVAIVRFSNTVSLALNFTTDRAAARNVLNSLTAVGDTALYDAAAYSADLLSDFEPTRSNLVFLSDGEESGASIAERQASIDALVASGATAYSFGLGASSDTEFLRAVADGTGGEFWEVADDRALADLFGSLGGRLGATDVVQVQTRPFALGAHTANIFATVNGERLEASAEFEVTNDGLLSITAVDDAEDGDPIGVHFSTLVSPSALRLEATVGGQIVPLNNGTSITIDPWRYAPGSVEVAVRALVSGGLAASTTVQVAIPALPPTLSIEQHDQTSLIVRKRVQGTMEITLALLDGETELASSTTPELAFTLQPGMEDLTIVLRDADGTVLTTDTVAGIAASAPSGSLPLMPLLVVIAAAATVFVVAAMWRRRSDRPEPTPLLIRAPRRMAPQSAPRDLELGTLVVRSPDGSEQSYRMGPRPLTIGRSPSCDIVLDDAEIRPVHARVSAGPGNQFRIHGLSSRGVPYQQQQLDEWLIVAAGEEVAIANFIVRMEAAAAVA